MAPSSLCGGVSRRVRVPELLYMEGGVATAVLVVGGDGGGDESAVGEHSVLEDDNVLSKDSEGDGDRERDRPLTCRLREGILSCLSLKSACKLL
jgi:hypothetical protein